MPELPSVARERRLRQELVAVRTILLAVHDSEDRPRDKASISVSLGAFCDGLATHIDKVLA